MLTTGSAGDNDRTLLHRCALRKFHMTDSQNTRDQITSDARDQNAFCALHSFLVEVQMNGGCIHAAHVQ